MAKWSIYLQANLRFLSLARSLAYSQISALDESGVLKWSQPESLPRYTKIQKISTPIHTRRQTSVTKQGGRFRNWIFGEPSDHAHPLETLGNIS